MPQPSQTPPSLVRVGSENLFNVPQAMEPFFSVLLSAMFLGERATAPVLLSLIPIVGGVAAASVSEVIVSQRWQKSFMQQDVCKVVLLRQEERHRPLQPEGRLLCNEQWTATFSHDLFHLRLHRAESSWCCAAARTTLLNVQTLITL